MIRRADSDAEHRWLTVNGDSPCADPLFYFAARSNTSTGKDLLDSLPLFAMSSTSATAALALLLVVVVFLTWGGLG